MQRQVHRDSDIYRRYAIGMYRQALSGVLPHVRAGQALRGLITSPARGRGQQPNSLASRRK